MLPSFSIERAVDIIRSCARAVSRDAPLLARERGDLPRRGRLPGAPAAPARLPGALRALEGGGRPALGGLSPALRRLGPRGRRALPARRDAARPRRRRAALPRGHARLR